MLVIADHTANPTYVAADLLSQAEHDKLASAVLLTDSMAQAQAISCEMERQAKQLPRWDIIKESVANYGCAIVFDDLKDACRMADVVAPEHLEVVTAAPRELLPVPAQRRRDLPRAVRARAAWGLHGRPVSRSATSGTARFFSPLSTDTFLKKPALSSTRGTRSKAMHRILSRSRRASIWTRTQTPSRCALRRKTTMRTAEIKRKTKETDISLKLTLEGGDRKIDTGIGFFDHMLEAFAVHSGFDLTLNMTGDLQVDCHHSIEDAGIVLGQALKEALGNKKGIVRYGQACIPLDESLSRVVLDLSGRPGLYFDCDFTAPMIGALDSQLVREFFQAVSNHAGMTLHIDNLKGENAHHQAESIFNAFARALRAAVATDERAADVIPSTKGAL